MRMNLKKQINKQVVERRQQNEVTSKAEKMRTNLLDSLKKRVQKRKDDNTYSQQFQMVNSMTIVAEPPLGIANTDIEPSVEADVADTITESDEVQE